MCYESDDHAEFYEASIVRARKPHRCECCCKTIQVGELYHYGSGKFDGDFFTSRHCGPCVLVIYRLHIIELMDGCPPQTSWYPAEDAWHEILEKRRNAEYAERVPAEQRKPYDWSSLTIRPMLERPTVEMGQAYLARKKSGKPVGVVA